MRRMSAMGNPMNDGRRNSSLDSVQLAGHPRAFDFSIGQVVVHIHDLAAACIESEQWLSMGVKRKHRVEEIVWGELHYTRPSTEVKSKSGDAPSRAEHSAST